MCSRVFLTNFKTSLPDPLTDHLWHSGLLKPPYPKFVPVCATTQSFKHDMLLRQCLFHCRISAWNVEFVMHIALMT